MQFIDNIGYSKTGGVVACSILKFRNRQFIGYLHVSLNDHL